MKGMENRFNLILVKKNIIYNACNTKKLIYLAVDYKA